MSSTVFVPAPDDPVTEFTLVGLVSCAEFQVCLVHIETLHAKYPELYVKPYIRPMLEHDWDEYLMKVQRKYGGQFWHLRRPLVVYANNNYLGDEVDLARFIQRRFHVQLNRDYRCLAQKGLLDVYKKYLEIGLYADLVPKTCKRFIRKCENKKFGYKGTDIHRIMDRSWIQFGDFTLPLSSRSCENYKVPHNRRGILSMCNDGRHTNNTTQFLVCLNPTPWMDYRYVAFGQLVQGGHVLKALEKLPTYYEHPEPHILKIADAGEITLEDTIGVKWIRKIEKHIQERDAGAPEKIRETVEDPRDVASILLKYHHRAGDYYGPDDHVGHLPMTNLPSRLVSPASSSSVTVSSMSAEEEGHDEDEYSLLLRKIDYEINGREEGEFGKVFPYDVLVNNIFMDEHYYPEGGEDG